MQRLAAEIDPSGQLTVALGIDLAAPDAGETIARELSARGLYCHTLINNAGFGLFGDAVELDRGRQLGIIQVNIRAATDLMLRFLPDMIERKAGRILNVGIGGRFCTGTADGRVFRQQGLSGVALASADAARRGGAASR